VTVFDDSVMTDI